MIDLLIVNSIGPAFTSKTTALGGSELEIVQVAHALARRGHRVVVANGVTSETEEESVRYVPFASAVGLETNALWIERMTPPPSNVRVRRIVVRATDICCPPYDIHKPALEAGAAAVVVNTKWQADGFTYAKEKIIIPPVLDMSLGVDTMGVVKKIPGLFVYPAAPMKGLVATLEMWRAWKTTSPKRTLLKKAKLKLALPGQSDFYGDKPVPLSDQDKAMGIAYGAVSSLVEYRRLIAYAEGLFYVNRMPETFCCAAAFAEAYKTRTHILCLNGKAGIPEALVNSTLVTEDVKEFERAFFECWQSSAKRDRWYADKVPDRSADALAPLWEAALGLKAERPLVVNPARALESDFAQEDLPKNREPFPPEFGTHLSALRSAIVNGGSEMGLGLILTALVAATRAFRVVEIGRFRGFSTLALAQGLALADAGWQEPKAAHQRPDVDYERLLAVKKRTLVSIDPFPTKEASELLDKAGLSKYLEYVDKKSEDVDPSSLGPIDVLLLDGQHELDHVRADVARYVPHVRHGGYFVMHDYFGWYRPDGENGSPIKRVIDEDLAGFERVLVDTGFASFVVFRKMTELSPQPARVPPRADGRPTVGLVLIAIGKEAATVVARAIVSAWKIVDAVTVVIDPAGGGEQTAEVARHIGADVYLRPSPKYDWEHGIGAIAGARNEAVAIAERKTDYVLALDADDTLEGELPKELTHDIYELEIHDAGAVYRRVQLWRSNKGFRYRGIIHETLECAGSYARIPTLKYMRRFGGGHQDAAGAAAKYSGHARLMLKWLIDHPDDTRAQFYLAQSYRDAGQRENAIREYEKRISMDGGNDEEKAFSAFQIGRVRREMGEDPTRDYLRAFELRPTRAEPLCDLAVWLRSDGRKRFALAAMVAKRASEIPRPDDVLFLEPAVYQWRALEEYAIAAYWSGDKPAALKAYEELRGRVPDAMRGHVETMMAMCKRELGQ